MHITVAMEEAKAFGCVMIHSLHVVVERGQFLRSGSHGLHTNEAIAERHQLNGLVREANASLRQLAEK